MKGSKNSSHFLTQGSSVTGNHEMYSCGSGILICVSSSCERSQELTTISASFLSKIPLNLTFMPVST